MILSESEYRQVISYYMEHETLLPQWRGDLVCEYIKRTLDDKANRARWKYDMMTRAIIKDSLMELVRCILQFFTREDEAQDEELETISEIMLKPMLSDEEKILQLKEWTDHLDYPSPLRGYCNVVGLDKLALKKVAQLSQKDAEEAVRKRHSERKEQFLESLGRKSDGDNGPTGESGKGIGSTDEEIVENWRIAASHYPEIYEIAQMIGREDETNLEEEEVPISHYVPQLLSQAHAYVEVDGVTSGKDIPMALPAEIALMSDGDAEWLFYQKFATSKLQLFSSVTPDEKVEQSETKEFKNRPEKGPIIVGIDTSGSMCGEPARIAKAMTMQLVELAYEQERKCYLILWSINAKAIELTSDGGWHKLSDFLSKQYMGGTDPTDFFEAAFKALDGEDFGMADVLMISDFMVPEPTYRIEQQIEVHQEEGTRFYGLQIGETQSNPYSKLLDKIWTRKTKEFIW